jgi:prepilin-type processing-associated H-X9-DG protein
LAECGINGSCIISGGGAYPDMIRTGSSGFHPGGSIFVFGDGHLGFLLENIVHDVLGGLSTWEGGDIAAREAFQTKVAGRMLISTLQLLTLL